MKNTPTLLLLTGIVALSGCHLRPASQQFSELPGYPCYRVAPGTAEVDIELIGIRPEVDRAELLKGIRAALAAAMTNTNMNSSAELTRNAQLLAETVMSGEKVVWHGPHDVAHLMAQRLEDAGVILKFTE